jgi:hypothetical protein
MSAPAAAITAAPGSLLGRVYLATQAPTPCGPFGEPRPPQHLQAAADALALAAADYFSSAADGRPSHQHSQNALTLAKALNTYTRVRTKGGAA